MAFRKGFSLILAISLIVHSGEFSPSFSAPASSTIPFINEAFLNSAISPFAHVGEFSKSNHQNSPFVIHIQDLHCNSEAQMNISKILETLWKKLHDDSNVLSHDGFLVLVEGAKGEIDTSLFGSFPDQRLKEEAALTFLREGRLSAAEFFAITQYSKIPVRIVGLEDEKLYQENLKAFKEVMDQKSLMDSFLAKVDKDFFRIAQKIFSKQLLEIFEKERSYQDRKIKFDEYIQDLLKQNVEHQTSLISNSPNLNSYIHILNLQRSLSREKVKKEAQALLEDLTHHSSKNDLALLVKKSLEYRLEKIPSLEYFHFLLGKAGVLKERSSELTKYVGLLEQETSLDHEAMIRELGEWVDSLKVSLANTPEAKNLLERRQKEILLEKILRLEASREEWDRFKKDKNVNGSPDVTSGDDKIKSLFSLAQRFYELACKRDEIMMKKTLESIAQNKSMNGKWVTVLITGGFHTSSVTKRLKKEDLDYAVLTPKTSTGLDGKIYQKLMMEELKNRHASSGLRHANIYDAQRTPYNDHLALSYLFDELARENRPEVQKRDLKRFAQILSRSGTSKYGKEFVRNWLMNWQKNHGVGASDFIKCVVEETLKDLDVARLKPSGNILSKKDIVQLIRKDRELGKLVVRVLKTLNDPLSDFAQKKLEKIESRPGPLDGKTIFRVFQDTIDLVGGSQTHLDALNRGLLERNRMTIVQMYLTTDPNEKEKRIKVGKGELILVPILRKDFSNSQSWSKAENRLYSEVVKWLNRSGIKGSLRSWLLTTPFSPVLSNLPAFRRFYGTGAEIESLLNIIKKYSVDLVMIHSLGAVNGVELVQRVKEQGIPCLAQHHGGNSSIERHYPRKMLDSVDGVTGVSSVNVPLHTRSRFVNLSNGVDMDFWNPLDAHPERISILENIPVIFLPSRIYSEKGQLEFLKIAQRLRDEGFSFKLVFAGGIFSSGIDEKIKILAKSYGLEEDIVLTGHLSREEMRDYYARSIVVVCPTQEDEGLPRVLLEAQAMQKPVVAYNKGGVPEAIEHGKTGYLVNPGDTDEFVNKVALLLENRVQRTEMGKAGRRFIRKKFSLSRMVRRHERFYLRFLDGSDGFIQSREGKVSARIFKAQKDEIEKHEIDSNDQFIIEQILESIVNHPEFPQDKKKEFRRQLNNLKNGQHKIRVFEGIVEAEEDYFLGKGSPREKRTFFAEDLIRELKAIPHNTLIEEYFLHEFLCPILGHEKAILLQQKIYPENYPDSTKLREQDPAHPYKGLLGDALRNFINKKALAKSVTSLTALDTPFLTGSEKREIAKRLREFHKKMKEELKPLRDNSEDPALYTITIREQRRFIEEFAKHFSILVKGMNRPAAIEEAWRKAETIYRDMMPSSDHDNNSQMVQLLPSDIKEVQKQPRTVSVRNFEHKISGLEQKVITTTEKKNFVPMQGHDQIISGENGPIIFFSANLQEGIGMFYPNSNQSTQWLACKLHHVKVLRHANRLTIIGTDENGEIHLFEKQGDRQFREKILERIHVKKGSNLEFDACFDANGNLNIVYREDSSGEMSLLKEDTQGQFVLRNIGFKPAPGGWSKYKILLTPTGQVIVLVLESGGIINILKENGSRCLDISTIGGISDPMSLDALLDKKGKLIFVCGSGYGLLKVYKEEVSGKYSIRDLKLLEADHDKQVDVKCLLNSTGQFVLVSGSYTGIRAWVEMEETLFNEKRLGERGISHLDAYLDSQDFLCLIASKHDLEGRWIMRSLEDEDDTYSKVTRSFENDTPTLFIRPINSLNNLERAIQKYQNEKKNVHVETITGTPFTDRTQLIGGVMPIPLDLREGSGEKFKFQKGVLHRLVDLAKAHPDQVYVLKIDQIEALPSKVRAQLQQYLLTGEMEIPETGEKLILPKNLKVMAVMTEGAVINDSAFYDRFIRRQLAPVGKLEVEKILREKLELPAKAIEELMKIHDAKPDLPLPQFLLLASYVKGRITDLREENITDEKMFFIVYEEASYFPTPSGPIRLSIPQGQNETSIFERWMAFKEAPLSFDLKTRRLLINGVELPICEDLKEKIERTLAGNQSYMPDPSVLRPGFLKTAVEQELVRSILGRALNRGGIKKVIKEETGLMLTEDVLRALSGIARALRYGPGMIRLEGPTGGGKTFLAEAVSKMMGIPFYGEPIHGQSKQSKWLGMFRPNENGDYILDRDTPFLRILGEGGVMALSELNTAVKEGQAKLGWWLVPLAEGKKEITLNEYPGTEAKFSTGSNSNVSYSSQSEADALLVQRGTEGRVEKLPPEESENQNNNVPTLTRTSDSLLVIDINPSKDDQTTEGYEARGELPPLLSAYTPVVKMTGRLTEDELKEFVRDELESLPQDIRDVCVNWLANFHYALQEELAKPDGGIFSKSLPYALTLRELKRTCQRLCRDLKSRDESPVKVLEAIHLFYARSFKIIGQQKKILELAIDSGGVYLPLDPTAHRDITYDLRNIAQKLLSKSSEQSIERSLFEEGHPTLLAMPTEINPLAPLRKLVAEKYPHTRIEKIECTQFTNDFTLFGGYVPDEMDIRHQRTGQPANRLTGNRKFKWAEGVLERMIREAQQAEEEDRDKPETERRIFIAAFENFHYLQPKLAIALNAILQEGTYYSPVSKKKIQVPKNLRFFATASKEAEFKISLAEQSRWVRIYEDNSHPRHTTGGQESPLTGLQSMQTGQSQAQVPSLGFPDEEVSPAFDEMKEPVKIGDKIYISVKKDSKWYLVTSDDMSIEGKRGFDNMESLVEIGGKGYVCVRKDKWYLVTLDDMRIEGKRGFDTLNAKVSPVQIGEKIYIIGGESDKNKDYLVAIDDMNTNIIEGKKFYLNFLVVINGKGYLSQREESGEYYLLIIDGITVERKSVSGMIFGDPSGKGYVTVLSGQNKYLVTVDDMNTQGKQGFNDVKNPVPVGEKVYVSVKEGGKWYLVTADDMSIEGKIGFEDIKGEPIEIEGKGFVCIKAGGKWYLVTADDMSIEGKMGFEDVNGEPIEIEGKGFVRIKTGGKWYLVDAKDCLKAPIEILNQEGTPLRLWIPNFLKGGFEDIDIPTQIGDRGYVNVKENGKWRLISWPIPTLKRRLKKLNQSYTVVDTSSRSDENDLLVPIEEMLDVEEKIVTAMNAHQITILEGEPGGGKTDMAVDVAERFGLPHHIYSSHGSVHLQDWIGSYSQDENGNYTLTCQPDDEDHFNIPFLEFYTHGGVFIIDEGAKGKRAQALIAWLTGIARGETELVLNEHPGKPPRILKRHPHFHVIITTNKKDNTPGQEEIPSEVASVSKVIQVPNDFSNKSYQAILKRYYEKFLGGKPAPPDLEKYIQWQIKMHRTMQKFVQESATINDPDRHLFTLRDLRNWTKAFLENCEQLSFPQSSSGNPFDSGFPIKTLGDDKIKEAFHEAFKLIYLAQFPEKGKAEAILNLFHAIVHDKREAIFTELFLDMRFNYNEFSLKKNVKENLKEIFSHSLHGMLLVEPGAREGKILEDFACEEQYEAHHLEGSPELTVQDLLGGLFPILEDEPNSHEKELRFKSGFLSRHLVGSSQASQEANKKKKLLIIHNIDALPEKVRGALHNFLLKGYVELPDETGKVRKYVLPPNVRLVATLSTESQREFASAFFNRFVKINVPAMTAFNEGFSEVLQVLMNQYGLSEAEARKVQAIYLMVKALEEGGEFWPSGKAYRFNVKDVLLHGQFVALAKEEAKAQGASLTPESIDRIIVAEALRLYGARVQEHRKDYKNFRDIVLKRIFPHEMVKELSGKVERKKGSVILLSGVRIPKISGAKPEQKIDRRYRLSLVPGLVRTLSSVLRGWQAGKMVSLTGETGVAKTTMGVFLAQLMGLDYYIYSTHGESKSRDLTASLQMTPQGNYRLQIQEFLKRLKKGNQVIVLDEANMRPEMWWILSGIARGQKKFTVEVPGEEPFEVEMGEHVFFLFAMNPESYVGRGEIPEVILEDVFKAWVEGEYEPDELDAILKDFLGLAEEKWKETFSIFQTAQMNLQGAMQKITIDQLLQIIEKGGQEVLQEIDPAELRELEKEILTRADVQEKMEKIRSAVKISNPNVKLIFTLQGWWSHSSQGDVIIVPLHELVNPKRSSDAVIGLIIHELRHDRYSLTLEERLEMAEKEPYREAMSLKLTPEILKEQKMEPLWKILIDLNYIDAEGHLLAKAKTLKSASQLNDLPAPFNDVLRQKSIFEILQSLLINPFFHELWNVIEDIRIDHMKDPALRGEDDYVAAMNKEFFPKSNKKKSIGKQKKKQILKAAALQPHRAFLNEVIGFGYRGEYSQIFSELPEEVRTAVKAVVEGVDASVLHEAVRALPVLLDFEAIQRGQKIVNDERIRAAKESIKVILEKIYPIYEELVKKSHENSKKSKKGKGKKGKGRGQGQAGAGQVGGGLPQFMVVTPEELQQILANASPETLPPNANVQQLILLVKGEKPVEEQPSILSPESLPKGEPPAKPASPPMSDADRDAAIERLNQAIQAARNTRQKQMKKEPHNLRMAEVSSYARTLAKGLIEAFRVPEDPEIEESATGLHINPIRYITRDPEPFDEEVDAFGKPDLALGVTIDVSRSMGDYHEAIKKMLAILMGNFTEIGRKKVDYAVSLITEEFDLIKGFKDQWTLEDLNRKQGELEEWIAQGGRKAPGGINLYNAVSGIIEKYKCTGKRNKLEIVITDGEDTGNDIEYLDHQGRRVRGIQFRGWFDEDGNQVFPIREGFKPVPSERLKAKLDEARKLGIEIVGIGFNTRDTEVFDSFIQLDKNKAELVVEALLKIAKRKATTGKLPKGDLTGPLGILMKRYTTDVTERSLVEERKTSEVKPGAISLSKSKRMIQKQLSQLRVQISDSARFIEATYHWFKENLVSQVDSDDREEVFEFFVSELSKILGRQVLVNRRDVLGEPLPSVQEHRIPSEVRSIEEAA